MALLLSLAGIYAVMSFTVSRRTREIGIRVALGSDRRRIVGAIFRRPLAQVALGITSGGILVFVLTHLITGLSAKEAGMVAAYMALMMADCARMHRPYPAGACDRAERGVEDRLGRA